MRASQSYIGSGSETESPRTVSSCPLSCCSGCSTSGVLGVSMSAACLAAAMTGFSMVW